MRYPKLYKILFVLVVVNSAWLLISKLFLDYNNHTVKIATNIGSISLPILFAIGIVLMHLGKKYRSSLRKV